MALVHDVAARLVNSTSYYKQSGLLTSSRYDTETMYLLETLNEIILEVFTLFLQSRNFDIEISGIRWDLKTCDLGHQVVRGPDCESGWESDCPPTCINEGKLV